MAALLDEYNVAKIAENTLLATLKENVIDNIVDRMVIEFKEKAKSEVKKEVEKLSIDVETFRDFERLRNEVKVYCEWKE
ncbi:MAG: hypothetical protein GY679_00980 [Mycoplasma sp.]|nr:hypothetical protein [Mycoplasma sp.]